MKTRFDLTLRHRWTHSLVSLPLDVEIPDDVHPSTGAELIECIRKGLLFSTENWRIHHLRILDLPTGNSQPATGNSEES